MCTDNKAGTTPGDPAEHLSDDEALLAYFEAVFKDGDSALIAAAINDAVQARGITDHDLSPDAGLDAVLRTLKAVGIGLTARAG